MTLTRLQRVACPWNVTAVKTVILTDGYGQNIQLQLRTQAQTLIIQLVQVRYLEHARMQAVDNTAC